MDRKKSAPTGYRTLEIQVLILTVSCADLRKLTKNCITFHPPTDIKADSHQFTEAHNVFRLTRWNPTVFSTDYIVLLKLASLPVEMLVLASSHLLLNLIGPSSL